MSKDIIEKNTTFDSIIRQQSKKSSKLYSLKKTYPAYIVLVIALIISYFVFNAVTNQVKSDLNNEFDKSVSSIMSRFESKYEKKLEIVKSICGLYDMMPYIVKDYFDLYATVPVNSYPSILCVSYIEKVRHADLDNYIYFISTQGYNHYSFKAKDKKDVYYAIHNFLPLKNNLHRHGLDMSSQPEFFSAALKAMSDNKIVSSQNYVSRSADTLSFFIIAPVYEYGKPRSNIQDRKNNLKAFIALELDSKKFFEDALQGEKGSKEVSFPTDTSVYFKIIDSKSDNSEFTVFQSSNFNVIPSNFNPEIKTTKEFNIANRKLRVDFSSIPNFGGSFRKTLPTVFLAISLVISFAFFGFVLSVTTSRARALDLADRMTKSQRRIVEASRDVITVINTEGKWLSINPASVELFGLKESDMINQSIYDLIVDDSDFRNYFINFVNSKTDKSDRITVKMKYGYEFKWINWNLTYSSNDNLIYATGRDVTLEKIAEEEAIIKTKQIQLAEMYAVEASESKTYFMKKLSHQLRNSLTGIIGYLQLLSSKVYDSEEEHDMFVEMAEQSSEEIFTYVSDTVDAAISTSANTDLNPELVNVGNAFVESFNKFKQSTGFSDSRIEISDTSLHARAVADLSAMSKIYSSSLLVLSSNVQNPSFTVEIQENQYEGATEIQLLSSANNSIIDLIEMYNNNSNDLISHIKSDRNDILFNLSNIASLVRRLNGAFSIQSLGKDEGNLISIQLPLNKPVE